jgi:beta-phosphoglucomutase family hydrolase
MPFSAFVFDMDGTLLDNMGFHIKIWIEFLASIGVVIDKETFTRRTVGRVNPEILRDLVNSALTDEEVDVFSLRKEIMYRERFTPHMREVPGLTVFLEQTWRQCIPVALATSAGRENADYVLNGLDIAQYFSAVVVAEDIQHGKPDPEIFLKAASRLGTAPENCLVFEDSPNGLEAAHRAGMRAVALTTTFKADQLAHLNAVLQVVSDYTGLSPEKLLASG